MRVNRFNRIWPFLKPKVEIIAAFVSRKYRVGYLKDDFVQEAAWAIFRTQTTTQLPHTDSYLLQRAFFAMKRYLSNDRRYKMQGFYWQKRKE